MVLRFYFSFHFLCFYCLLFPTIFCVQLCWDSEVDNGLLLPELWYLPVLQWLAGQSADPSPPLCSSSQPVLSEGKSVYFEGLNHTYSILLLISYYIWICAFLLNAAFCNTNTMQSSYLSFPTNEINSDSVRLGYSSEKQGNKSEMLESLVILCTLKQITCKLESKWCCIHSADLWPWKIVFTL